MNGKMKIFLVAGTNQDDYCGGYGAEAYLVYAANIERVIDFFFLEVKRILRKVDFLLMKSLFQITKIHNAYALITNKGILGIFNIVMRHIG